MTAYGGKELANGFRTVRKNTIQGAEDIPESQYDHVPAPDCRSVGRMLTHVAISTRVWDEIHRKQRLTTMVGVNFLGMLDQFAAWLDTLTPEFLAEMVTEGDGKTNKSRLDRLLSAKEHEMHHRAQLMLIERQLGIVPHLTRQFQERVAQMRAAKA